MASCAPCSTHAGIASAKLNDVSDTQKQLLPVSLNAELGQEHVHWLLMVVVVVLVVMLVVVVISSWFSVFSDGGS